MHEQNMNEQMQSIEDLNLSYLLLAQRLIREDNIAAGFHLGLNETTMETIKGLSLPQLIKLSSTGQLISRLRIDDEALIACLTKESRIDALQRFHTGIILSSNLLSEDNESKAA
ncbi:flagellar transcriptional activator FlhD [Kosakonia radicincitans DSM 16656]|uniref:Flagellar transcriptional regulator FlhD n=1 Tax=Kosakonia radicincitans TaxID=283686 RepID=A0AAX2EQK5_9ENTR|nr:MULTISPECIES: flagellar transcriptional regulator FlhD [Kosakonia]MDP9566130.1 flagellar transcriptional activator FlhD [Kosakonia oryzae]APG19339.1 flagellar transcriptional activator FlhD [Kosakonia radicincitans]ARD59525.1 flagellar transcriptional activator FlhD [Kosakonia radicincitans DSM 16656]KDE35088.1 transcriptional regulator [Kosakonia radicincitans UMEnt01/12]MDD7996520.1 flagellar transcriptional regulator FlhD [Kosakonia radicincitans]